LPCAALPLWQLWQAAPPSALWSTRPPAPSRPGSAPPVPGRRAPPLAGGAFAAGAFAAGGVAALLISFGGVPGLTVAYLVGIWFWCSWQPCRQSEPPPVHGVVFGAVGVPAAPQMWCVGESRVQLIEMP